MDAKTSSSAYGSYIDP